MRAGATNAPMVSALGVNIRRLFMLVFGFGAMLAGFAGIMIAPILSVEPGIGDTIRVSLSADPVEEIRVGFDIAALAQVAQFRLVVAPPVDLPVELRERQHRHPELSGEVLEVQRGVAGKQVKDCRNQGQYQPALFQYYSVNLNASTSVSVTPAASQTRVPARGPIIA